MKPLFESETSSKSTDITPSMAPQLDKNLPSVQGGGIPAIRKPIPVITEEEIKKWGTAEGTGLASLSKELLSQIKACDAAEFGAELNKLVLLAKGLDPKSVEGKGILARARNLFSSSKERMLAQYNTVTQQSGSLLSSVEAKAQSHQKRIGDLERMYVENMNYHEKLEHDVADIERRVAEMQYAVANYGEPKTTFEAQILADAERSIRRADKKKDDLKRVMALAKQNGPRIRSMQDQLSTLIDGATDVKTVTFPAWEGVFARYLIDQEISQSAAVLHGIHDATNEALRRGADLARQNARDVAALAQRPVIDFETLQYIHTNTIGQMEDVRRIDAEAAERRKAEAPQIEAMEKELIALFAPGQR